MIDDDSADALILSPLKQGLVNGCHHARGARMNGFWAVQANAADAAFSGNQDFIGHWRSMSLATILRMTWLVPSRMAWTRRSARKSVVEGQSMYVCVNHGGPRIIKK